jgi:hypothetical protein
VCAFAALPRAAAGRPFEIIHVLSFLASKYQEKQNKPNAFAQYFISGAILISLLGVMIPDAFPTFPLTASDMALPNFTNMMATAVATGDDMDIQVGPIRR